MGVDALAQDCCDLLHKRLEAMSIDDSEVNAAGAAFYHSLTDAFPDETARRLEGTQRG